MEMEEKTLQVENVKNELESILEDEYQQLHTKEELMEYAFDGENEELISVNEEGVSFSINEFDEEEKDGIFTYTGNTSVDFTVVAKYYDEAKEEREKKTYVSNEASFNITLERNGNKIIIYDITVE